MVEKFDRLFVSTFKVTVFERKADIVILHKEHVLCWSVVAVKSGLYSPEYIYICVCIYA